MALEKLVEIMAKLRSEQGCPWDKAQDHGTLTPYLIEETYELVEALDGKDHAHIKEELGDLLFQIVFHAHIKAEEGSFTMNDVIEEISNKMIRRHPHVFPSASSEGDDLRFDTKEQVMAQWDDRKKEEGKLKNSAIEGMLAAPNSECRLALPSLLRAYRVQKKAAKVGLDWEKIGGAVEKLEEEVLELKEALKNKNSKEEIEQELGDLLFSIVNVSRFLDVNPECALRRSVNKFVKRFHYVENSIKAYGLDIQNTGATKLDELWEEAKKKYL